LFIFFTVYDVLTGEMVHAIEGHKDVVRDVAWHPTRQEILSSSVRHLSSFFEKLYVINFILHFSGTFM
jgi:hypothetical protein